jgi:probable phosphoglycerate mutase
MQTRVVEAVARIVVKHKGGVVVAVSHADPIKAVAAHALGTHLDLFQRIVISPCSVTAIAYSAAAPNVLTVNDTGRSLRDLRPS